MNTLKYSCGSIIPSSCVPFTGAKPAFLAEELPCDANIDDVIKKISDAVNALTEATKVSHFTSTCVTLQEPKTVRTVLSDVLAKLCALQASLETTQETLAALDVQDELVTIDLGCLAAAAAPCQIATNTYSLASVLNLFRAEICGIKSHLGI